MVSIQQLDISAINRIGEVDRREHVTLKYTQVDGQLVPEKVDWNIPRWATDDSPFSANTRIKKWTPILEQGGAMFGALEKDALCGFSIVNPKSIEGVAEVVALFVGRDWRKQGLGRQLTSEAEKFAHDAGAKAIFASSNDTEAAVRFYLSQGYDLAETAHPKLYAKLYAIDPDGIHMVKSLDGRF